MRSFLLTESTLESGFILLNESLAALAVPLVLDAAAKGMLPLLFLFTDFPPEFS